MLCTFAAFDEYDLAVERLYAAIDRLQYTRRLYDQLRSEKGF